MCQTVNSDNNQILRQSKQKTKEFYRFFSGIFLMFEK